MVPDDIPICNVLNLSCGSSHQRDKMIKESSNTIVRISNNNKTTSVASKFLETKLRDTR